MPCCLEEGGLGLGSCSILGYCHTMRWDPLFCFFRMVKPSLLTHEVSKAKVVFVMNWCSFMWSSLFLLIACESTIIPGESSLLSNVHTLKFL